MRRSYLPAYALPNFPTSSVDYDPVKDRLGAAFTRSTAGHRLFFRALDTVFLRAWYVHGALRRLLGRLPNRGLRVLDAGTGFGQYADWMIRRDRRVHVTAVDIKDAYLDTARGYFEAAGLADRIAFRVQDLTAPPPETDAFDLILSVDVMEHIEDDRAVFRHFRTMLRPGGYVVVNTPSDRGGSDVEAEGESFIGEHVRDGYAPDELAEKLETAGLEVVEWTYTYGRYGSAAWRLLVKRPITWLNRSWALAPALVPYYAVAGPLGLALNALDVRAEKPEGTGLLMVARRMA